MPPASKYAATQTVMTDSVDISQSASYEIIILSPIYIK